MERRKLFMLLSGLPFTGMIAAFEYALTPKVRLPIAKDFDYEWYLTITWNNLVRNRQGQNYPVNIRVSPEFFKGYMGSVQMMTRNHVTNPAAELRTLVFKSGTLRSDDTLQGLETHWTFPETV